MLFFSQLSVHSKKAQLDSLVETKEHSILTSPKGRGDLKSAKSVNKEGEACFHTEIVLLLSDERSQVSCRKAIRM